MGSITHTRLPILSVMSDWLCHLTRLFSEGTYSRSPRNQIALALAFDVPFLCPNNSNNINNNNKTTKTKRPQQQPRLSWKRKQSAGGPRGFWMEKWACQENFPGHAEERPGLRCAGLPTLAFEDSAGQIDRAQNKALRKVSGHACSTIVEAVRWEANVPSYLTTTRRLSAVSWEKAKRVQINHPREVARRPGLPHRLTRSN